MLILKTRLYKPPVDKKFIFRERLIARLNNESGRPLKLIIAGAGYGKSILMSQWLDTYRKNYCWISLEDDCNDLNVFLSYLVAGIQQKFPEYMQHIAQISTGSQMPSYEAIAQTVNNELHDLPESIAIVLDDFHVIKNKAILNLFNEFIKYPPENVSIALISRLDPPLNKSRLLAYQQVTEIRMADLRLSTEEIKELAKRSAQIDITTETAEAIERVTEGWALSVYLKIREIAEGNVAEIDKHLGYQHSGNLTPFLFDLLESRLPPAALKLVLVISLFDRFNTGLIQRLYRDTDEADLKGEGLDLALLKLKQLDSPFLISLDDEGNWFRIHHLIRNILNKRLFQVCSSEQIEKYYKAAGAYFADQYCFEEGIKYSILGKDEEKAVETIVLNWEKLLDYGKNMVLYHWIKMLPSDLVQSNPTLLVINAYLCDPLSDFESMAKYLEEASKLIDEETSPPRLIGSFSSVHSAYSCYTNNQPEALEHATKALNWLLPDQGFLLDYAQNFKAFALNTLLSGEAAREFILNNRSGLQPGERMRLMRSHVIQMFIDWHHARLLDLKDSGQLVVEISKSEKVWWFYKVGYYYLGQYHYMKNQVKEVYGFIDEGISCSFNSSPIWALHLYYTGTLAALAECDVSKAQEYLDSAKELIRMNNLDQFQGYVRSFEVEAALRTNNIELAWQLNQDAVYATHPPFYYYYVPQFTQIKLYIQKGDDDLMKEAGEMIFQFKESAKAINNLHAQIQIMILEGVWLSRSGQTEEAVSLFKELVNLIDEPKYIRVFLDMGQPVKELLQLLPEEDKQRPLVRNVLNAFRYEPNLQPPAAGKEELTPKERKIMDLVFEGLPNKEIADQLFLSESTIKTYLYRIYQKLGVKNRYAALRKLRQA